MQQPLKIIDQGYRPVSELGYNTVFQRKPTEASIAEVTTSIMESGFWQTHPIVLDENDEMVDGQTRAMAAERANVSLVPFIKVLFPDMNSKIEYFIKANTTSRKMPGDVIRHDQALIQKPYASLLHRLSTDPESLLFGRVNWRGINSKTNFTVAEEELIVNSMALELHSMWTKEKSQRLEAKAAVIDYSYVLRETNNFLDFQYQWHGRDMRRNGIRRFEYRSANLRAFLTFYCLMKDQGFLTDEKSIRHIIEKMRTFPIDGMFSRLEHNTRVTNLVNHFNIRLQRKRLSYTPSGKVAPGKDIE